MMSPKVQASYRLPAVLEQLAAAHWRRATSGRFTFVSTFGGIGREWNVGVLRDGEHPDRWVITADVLTHTAGHNRRRTWVTCVDNPDEIDEVVGNWASFFDRGRFGRIELPQPASPADPAYWFLDSDWRLLEVPEWAARRLAMLAASYSGLEGSSANDSAAHEAIAWAVVTVGLHDTAYPPLLHPAEVRRRYGLVSDMTPAQTIAALWWLQDFGHRGPMLDINGSGWAHRDPCELATVSRLSALGQWIGQGNAPAALAMITVDDHYGAGLTDELIWLSHGKFGDEVARWRDVLTALGISETPETISDLALMWEADVSPSEALAWGQAVGQRRIRESFSWTRIAVHLIPVGIQPTDVAYHARRRGAASMDTLNHHLTTLAEQGWMREEIRHIPWPVRDQYRKAQHRADEAAEPYRLANGGVVRKHAAV